MDAFTKQPFSGNPAAVCLLEEDLSDEEKQLIAREMNISETCYLTKDNGKSFTESDTFGLRWFTPTNEVPLCGHATLAAAAVIFKVYYNNIICPKSKDWNSNIYTIFFVLIHHLKVHIFIVKNENMNERYLSIIIICTYLLRNVKTKTKF